MLDETNETEEQGDIEELNVKKKRKKNSVGHNEKEIFSNSLENLSEILNSGVNSNDSESLKKSTKKKKCKIVSNSDESNNKDNFETATSLETDEEIRITPKHQKNKIKKRKDSIVESKFS